MKDYATGCPLCGVHHHKGTTMGFSGMNRRCAERWNKMRPERKALVTARWLLASQART